MDSNKPFEFNRRVGFESSKLYNQRGLEGFWHKYLKGDRILDIGYRGGTPDALPICDGASGLELGDPGYDGFRLPYPMTWFDAVHASHVLEHVSDAMMSLEEWFRVIREGGFLILMVPHAYLYERRLTVPPSRWSPEHVRCFTPATLLKLIEHTLPPNTYRIRHLADRDDNYDYALSPYTHPTGALEIECIVEKIAPPPWRIEP